MKRIVAIAVGGLIALGGLGADYRGYSLVTRDGRRLVSRMEGTNEVFELVATNALPSGLKPPRVWKLCVVKATHTDIGLHNSQYIQRHGAVTRTRQAHRIIATDPRDDDPAAYRYVCEGTWFWHNTLEDRGMDAMRAIVTNDVARGRLDIASNCAGNHTHVFGCEELARSAYAKRWLEDACGVTNATMLMTDNPGLSWSLVEPLAQAGIRNILFSPNQWNPHPSTIWPMRKGEGDQWSPHAGGGGSRIDINWNGTLPLLFRWLSPDGGSELLVCSGGCYSWATGAFGFKGWNFDWPKDRQAALRTLARQLDRMEQRYPVDLWVWASYGDDECANDGFSRFAKKWNETWAWPQFRTVGRLDEPFDYLRRNFGDKIETVRGEMASGWLQHIVCAPSLLARKQAADRLLPQAEALAALATATGRMTRDPSVQDALDDAWWFLICNDEHSYGTSGYQGRRVFETWMQHRDWIERAEATATNVLARAARALEIDAPAEPVRTCVNGRTCENRWYRVTATAAGEITSLYDKELGRELLTAPANRFLYTRDNHKSWDKPETLGAEIVQKVYLVRDEKRVDVENEFRHARDLFNKNRYNRYGYLAFPFDVPSPRFYAQLNGPVIDVYGDQSGYATDAYAGVRDWGCVENGAFGVALFQQDSFLMEFGKIHPDKTSFEFGKAPQTSGLYSYLFTDWLQMHQPDGDSFNLTFRYAITSYRGTWRDAHLPARAERLYAPYADVLSKYVTCDRANVRLLTLKPALDGRGYIARFRETEGRATRATLRQSIVKDAVLTRCGTTERDRAPLAGKTFDLVPFGTATIRIAALGARAVARTPKRAFDLIARPRAGHGEKKGQMYLLWQADLAADFSHYELYRAERPVFPRDASTFVANVKNEAPDGVPYRNARYEDLGLRHHTRYWYDLRPVYRDGRKGAFAGTFSGLTRGDETAVPCLAAAEAERKMTWRP